MFIFTHRWSIVHHTWVTVLWHVRVSPSSNLLIGQLNGAVAEADGTVLDLDDLASWRARQVINVSLQWASWSFSQFKLLLQKSLKLNYDKVTSTLIFPVFPLLLFWFNTSESWIFCSFFWRSFCLKSNEDEVFCTSSFCFMASFSATGKS